MFFDYLKIFSAFLFLFFLPGFSILYLILRQKVKISPLEHFVFSVGISLALINFLLLFLNKIGVSLNSSNIFNATFLLIVLPFVISTFFSWHLSALFKKKKDPVLENIPDKTPSYLQLKKKQFFTAIVLICVSFFITTIFLREDIVPNNTDLGHHMYWVKLIVEEESIPEYSTSDVIVGEHLPFAALAKITGISILSAFPVILLASINFISFLVLYLLTLRIFKKQFIAWLVFLFSGVFYVALEPFGKFASGGVVGNVLGNLFILLILLALYLAFTKKRSELLALAVFLSGSLFYIHHLSAFLLFFILMAFGLIYLGINFKNLGKIIKKWSKLIFTPLSLLVIGFFIFNVGWVYLPHYISEQAVTSVVKNPLKESHQGVSLASFISSIGEWRVFLGMLGLVFFSIISFKSKKYKKYSFSLLFGWILILCFLSFFPQLFLVDLPSRRVVNYLIPPLSLMAGYFTVIFFKNLKNKLEPNLFLIILAAFTLAISLNGFSSSFKLFLSENQFEDAVQLYHASQYLEEKTSREDVILKDHANLKADTWIKFFFLRGYDYVLVRTFDYKYEDPTNERETCTRDMIIAPDSAEGKKCYQETGTNYLILRKDIDNFFFEFSDNFSKIYSNDSIVIFKRTSDNP